MSRQRLTCIGTAAHRFMTKKKSSRKGGATTRRSSRSLLTMAKGTFDGISCSRYR
uniref:Uncharacterized protein n=1 Tax=Chrysemys picta bellii TaxID=8478 RepID=A0A8C3FJV9_CHRPI